MSRTRRRDLSILIGGALTLLGAGTATNAQVIGPQTLNQLIVPGTIDPPPFSPACQSPSNTFARDGAGIRTRPTQWLRRYDLDGMYGITGDFVVTGVKFAIESADGTPASSTSPGIQDLTVNVYCYSGDHPFSGIVDYSQLVLQDSLTFSQSDTSLTFTTVPIGGTCNGVLDDLVVEVAASDCLDVSNDCDKFFIGANSLGETAPGYIAAVQCGLPSGAALALIGFLTSGETHVNPIIIVDGVAEGRTPVPALGLVGTSILTVLMLGATAFFLIRQRVTN